MGFRVYLGGERRRIQNHLKPTVSVLQEVTRVIWGYIVMCRVRDFTD